MEEREKSWRQFLALNIILINNKILDKMQYFTLLDILL